MGSYEENYDEATLSSFTEEERIQLRELHRQLDAKFDEIVSFIGAKLGYEPKVQLQRLLHEHHAPLCCSSTQFTISDSLPSTLFAYSIASAGLSFAGRTRE